MGGGFVLVPLQVMWAGVSQRHANANSLVAIIPIAIAALPIYFFRKGAPQVDLHLALFLIIGSAIGAFTGARLLRSVPERELKLIVSAILLVVGLKEIIAP